MSRQRRINQQEKKPVDVQAAMKIVDEANREMQERSKRCTERVAAILAEEQCEIVVQGQFSGNQIESKIGFAPRPLTPADPAPAK